MWRDHMSSNLKTSFGFSSSVEDLVPSLVLEPFWFERPYERKKYFTVPCTTCLVKFFNQWKIRSCKRSGGSRPWAKGRGGGGVFFLRCWNKIDLRISLALPGFSSFCVFSLFYLFFCQNKGGPGSPSPPLDPPRKRDLTFEIIESS